MDEQFLYDFRTGCGNSAKFARIFDMGFSHKTTSEDNFSLHKLDLIMNYMVRHSK